MSFENLYAQPLGGEVPLRAALLLLRVMVATAIPLPALGRIQPQIVCIDTDMEFRSPETKIRLKRLARSFTSVRASHNNRPIATGNVGVVRPRARMLA